MRYQLLKYSSNISIENSFDDEKEELYDTYRVPNDKTILLNDENRNLAPWDISGRNIDLLGAKGLIDRIEMLVLELWWDWFYYSRKARFSFLSLSLPLSRLLVNRPWMHVIAVHASSLMRRNKTSAGTFDENIFKIPRATWFSISTCRNYRINKIPS